MLRLNSRHVIRRSMAVVVAMAAAWTPLVSSLAAEPAALGEIIVTARKRAETLQDVPLAVSAIDGKTIEELGIQNITDTYSRIPNLYFTNAGGASPNSDYDYLVIRGVGFNGGLEPAVGVFIDGMYQPQVGFDTAFLDLERVEVLRGPQGTLFGRNTQAGAINIVTRKPGKDPQGRVELEAGKFDTFRALASYSGPITDTLSGGLSMQYSYTNGYVKNTVLNLNQAFSRQWVGRGTLVWAPTDRFTGTLIIDGVNKDMREPGFGAPITCHCYDTVQDQIGPMGYKNSNGQQLNIEYKLSDSITLTSISGRRQVKSQSSYDWDAHVSDLTPMTLSAVTETNSPPIVPIDVAPQPITVAGAIQIQPMSQTFGSQELRLSGTGNTLDWLAGAYWFKQDMLQPRAVDIGPGVPFLPLYIRERFTESRHGYAGFGQVTWRPLDHFEFTVGTRYSNEKARTGGERVINIADIAIRAFLKDDQKDASNVSSMASVSWKPTSTLRVYATFAQGWKAGGVNRYPSRANAVLPYADEKSNNYDLGLKARWLDGRIVTDLSLFYIDIRKQQVLNVVPDPNGLTPITVIDNAGKSSSRGLEAEIAAKLTDTVTLTVDYGYTDGKFDQFLQIADLAACNPAAPDGVACRQRRGDRFWFVPQHTGNVALDWRLPLAGRDVTLSANWRYVGDYDIPDGNLNARLGGELHNKSYDRLDLRARYDFGQGWEAAAYVRNVLDSLDYTLLGRDAFAPSPTPTPADTYGVPLEPRTFGVVVTRRF